MELQKRFRPYDPTAPIPSPSDLRALLPEDHLAFFVSDVIDELDLTAFYEPYRDKSQRGQPPYDPRMMVKLLVYAYTVGIPSSRRIELKTYEDLPFRVLTCDQHPDHDTISGFRKQHLQALSRLFVQVLAIAHKAGLAKLGHVALDGTKIKANASKHKAMSYSRMGEKEAELQAEVQALIRQAEQEDDKEDVRYGKGKQGDERGDELRFKQQRLDTIRQAKQALEAEAREQAIAEGKLNPDGTPTARRGRKPNTPPGQPKPKAQRNFTDPESRIMKNGDKAFVQGYNCQAAVDADSQMIVAADVTDEANDKQQADPMATEIEDNMGRNPDQLSADSGYFSEQNVQLLEARNIDVYISPGREKKNPSESDDATSSPAPASTELSVKDRMKGKVGTPVGKATYSKRKETVEPVFGQMKQGRGLRQFLLRSLEQVRAEWRLWCLGHNILKLWRSGWKPQLATG